MKMPFVVRHAMYLRTFESTIRGSLGELGGTVR
jgi:hypothetical protein